MRFNNPGLALVLTSLILGGLALFLRSILPTRDRWTDPNPDPADDHLFD